MHSPNESYQRNTPTSRLVRTAIYARVSTSKQAEEGDSIPAQLAALHDWIDSKDTHICVGEYVDDGVSGTKQDRDELQKLLSEIRQNHVDLVIVTKLDRWFRSIRHYINTQELLDAHHCNWTAIWEPIYDTTTPQGRLIINQMMSIAQFEAENTGQRLRQVWEYKVTKGEVLSGRQPIGFDIVDKHLVPNNDADLVRQAFEYYAATGNLSGTMSEFAHYGVFPTTRGSFRKILMNTKYIGEHRGNTEYCPPIVSKELFEEVQQNLNKNVKSSTKYTYVFSGLIICAECGTRFVGQGRVHHKGAERVNAYRCKGYWGRFPKQCSNSKIITESRLEEIMVERLRKDMEELLKSYEADEDSTGDGNKKKLAILQHKIDRLKELYINDLITLEEYKRDKEEYQQQMDAMQITKPAPQLSPEAIKAFLDIDFESAYPQWTGAEKRRFWRSVLKAIYFTKDRQITPDFL